MHQRPIGDHGNPQAAPFSVALRNEHPLDRSRPPRVGVALQPGGHLGLLPSRKHDPAVDPGRLAASVKLGDPPHAQQSVRAGTKHQLLQIADPLEVPRLRRRENSSPQPPYVTLNPTPIHGIPVADLVLRSVHRHGVQLAHRFWRLRSSGLHRLTRPTSAPFRAGQHARIRPVMRQPSGGGAESAVAGFPSPFGVSALASWVIQRPLGSCTFLTVGLPAESTAGPQRGCHVAHEQDSTGQGAPFTPGTVVRSRPATTLRPAPAAFQRPVPTAPLTHPIGGGHLHEASSGVHSRSPITPGRPDAAPQPGSASFPPVFSLPAAPGWNGNRFGFDLGLRTPQSPAEHAEAETGPRALARVLHLRHQPNLQTVPPTSLMHPHVAPNRRSLRAPPQGQARPARAPVPARPDR